MVRDSALPLSSWGLFFRSHPSRCKSRLLQTQPSAPNCRNPEGNYAQGISTKGRSDSIASVGVDAIVVALLLSLGLTAQVTKTVAIQCNSSLPFLSLPFPSLPFASLRFASIRFYSILCAYLRFSSLLFFSLLGDDDSCLAAVTMPQMLPIPSRNDCGFHNIATTLLGMANLPKL